MNDSWKNNNLIRRLTEENEVKPSVNLNSVEKKRYIKLIDDLDQFCRKMNIDNELKTILKNARDEIKNRMYTSDKLPINKVVLVTLNTSTYDPSEENKHRGHYVKDSNGNYRDITRTAYVGEAAGSVARSININSKVPYDSQFVLGWSDGEKFHIIGESSFQYTLNNHPEKISDTEAKELISKVFNDDYINSLLNSRWANQVKLGKNYNKEEYLPDIKEMMYRNIHGDILEAKFCLDLESIDHIISYFSEDFEPVYYNNKNNYFLNRWYEVDLENFEEKMKNFMEENNLN